MKKTLRKIAAILLATLLLTLSLPLQSFAISLVPEIEKIEVSEGSQAVSLKEIDRYFTELLRMLEENEIDLDNIKEDMPSIYESLFSVPLYASNFEYKFDVILDSGKEYTFSTNDDDLKLNKIHSVEIDAYITYESYLQAKESGADEIPVKINATVYSDLTYDYVAGSEYTAEVNLPLIEMYVKSITPVSGIPEKAYYDSDYIDVEGAEFIIEYADGEAVTATVKTETDDFDPYAYNRYTLNGETFYVYDLSMDDEEEDYEINFEYLDAYCTTPIEYIDGSLFESVKITDCVFDAENAYLVSITYELIYNDGRTATFTKEFTESENPFVTVDPIINSIDGYDIRLSCYLGDYSEDGESFNTDKYYITVFAGSTSDTYEVENPHKDIMNGSLNIAQFFINLYIKIQEIFSRILSLIMFGF